MKAILAGVLSLCAVAVVHWITHEECCASRDVLRHRPVADTRGRGELVPSKISRLTFYTIFSTSLQSSRNAVTWTELYQGESVTDGVYNRREIWQGDMTGRYDREI
uniref:Secreted protein n=1 Tax=Timema monikensis TaxID=170555 RepID=A0A7R9HTJ7_9NEOP|nr:unnamed protein product [Timema monikensis]